MAKGFQYREVSNFPEIDIWEDWKTEVQLNLISDVDMTAHSTLRFLGESEHLGYLKYRVTHETVTNITVRVQNQLRENPIQVMKFNAFRSKNGRTVLFDANKRHVAELLRRMHQTVNELQYWEREVDLILMKKKVEMDVSGGWFRNLRVADVSTAALFGATVTASTDWDRYERSGELSMLHIEFRDRGELHKLNVTSNGTVVLLQNYDEAEQLELVEKVSDAIEPFATRILKD